MARLNRSATVSFEVGNWIADLSDRNLSLEKLFLHRPKGSLKALARLLLFGIRIPVLFLIALAVPTQIPLFLFQTNPFLPLSAVVLACIGFFLGWSVFIITRLRTGFSRFNVFLFWPDEAFRKN